MAKWAKISGPREYDKNGLGGDIDVGWAYTITAGGEERTIGVEVAGGRLQSSDLPEECREAIRSQGWSAITPHLDEDVPPRRIKVTTGGLSATYE